MPLQKHTKALQQISKLCDPCQRVKNAPIRFRISFGAEHVRFNERIMIGVMYINHSPILHIVDEGTRFYAARFLGDVSHKENLIDNIGMLGRNLY